MAKYKYSLVQFDATRQSLLTMSFQGTRAEIPRGWAIARRTPRLPRATRAHRRAVSSRALGRIRRALAEAWTLGSVPVTVPGVPTRTRDGKEASR